MAGDVGEVPVTNGPRATVRRIEHAPAWQHVVVWLAGVLFAVLIPLLAPYFHGLDQNNPPGMRSLLGGGELLLISLVILITGIAELILAVRNISAGQVMAVAAVILGGLLAVVTEAFWYADIAAQSLDIHKALAPHVVSVITLGSLIMLSASAIGSAACVYLAAKNR